MAKKNNVIESTACNARTGSGRCNGRLIDFSVLAEGLRVVCSKCRRNAILKISYAHYLKIKAREDRRD